MRRTKPCGRRSVTSQGAKQFKKIAKTVKGAMAELAQTLKGAWSVPGLDPQREGSRRLRGHSSTMKTDAKKSGLGLVEAFMDELEDLREKIEKELVR